VNQNKTTQKALSEDGGQELGPTASTSRVSILEPCSSYIRILIIYLQIQVLNPLSQSNRGGDSRYARAHHDDSQWTTFVDRSSRKKGIADGGGSGTSRRAIVTITIELVKAVCGICLCWYADRHSA
jgi:hypothetical protein